MTPNDLVRLAAGEWEHHLARSPAGVAMLVAIGYCVLGAVWIVTGLAGNLLAALTLGSQIGFRLDFASLAVVPAAAILYVGGLVVNLPLFTILRLAHHRITLGAARFAGAIGMACWGGLVLFRMESFDVWRHGAPDAGYWMTTLLPWGVAWACAGAVIGGALAERGRHERP